MQSNWSGERIQPRSLPARKNLTLVRYEAFQKKSSLPPTASSPTSSSSTSAMRSCSRAGRSAASDGRRRRGGDHPTPRSIDVGGRGGSRRSGTRRARRTPARRVRRTPRIGSAERWTAGRGRGTPPGRRRTATRPARRRGCANLLGSCVGRHARVPPSAHRPSRGSSGSPGRETTNTTWFLTAVRPGERALLWRRRRQLSLRLVDARAGEVVAARRQGLPVLLRVRPTASTRKCRLSRIMMRDRVAA